MTVTLSELLLGLVLAPFGWIFLDWGMGALGDWRDRRRGRRLVRRCHLCGKNYPEEARVRQSCCPACQGVNDRRGHRKLG